MVHAIEPWQKHGWNQEQSQDKTNFIRQGGIDYGGIRNFTS